MILCPPGHHVTRAQAETDKESTAGSRGATQNGISQAGAEL